MDLDFRIYEHIRAVGLHRFIASFNEYAVRNCEPQLCIDDRVLFFIFLPLDVLSIDTIADRPFFYALMMTFQLIFLIQRLEPCFLLLNVSLGCRRSPQRSVTVN